MSGNKIKKYILLIVSFGFLGCANAKDLPMDSLERSQQSCLALTEEVCAELSWKVGPSTKVENKALLLFKNIRTKEIVSVTSGLQAYLWMPGMGHGSSPIRIDYLDEGVVMLSTIHFIMPGEWELRLQLQGSDEKSFTFHL